jgi:DNA-binding MarR family transcriptional regulator
MENETERAEVAKLLMWNLRRFIVSVVAFNDQVANKVGLGASEMQVMHLLELNGPMLPSELARQLGLSSGTTTGVIDRLERRHLVSRERDPGDRRKIRVTVNEERAYQEIGRHYAERGQRVIDAMEGLDLAELEGAARFFTSLMKERLSPGSGPKAI